MQLAQATRFDLHQRRGDRRRRAKGLRIDDPYAAAPGPDRLLRHHAVAEAMRELGAAANSVRRESARNRSREDVQLIGVRYLTERGSRNAEVLAEHLGRGVLEPVAEQERIVLVERSVVEHEQELAAVGPQALDGVRNARREVPEIADADVVDEAVALRIDGRYACGAVEHVSPFRGLVPMQLTHAAGVQAHVDARDGRRDPQLAHGHLPRPPTGFESDVGVGEREAEVRKRSAIGRRRDE